jgi:UDP-N-acetylglucosamine--N-acetylmuramyl-(pentapeptide) pyrophosphoryl-undecaprenol N-acetylglucosamine transferase
LTGNPIRPNIIKPNPKRPEWLSYTPSKPILYITGGNQGSEILNSTVEQTLPILTNQWFIIHQCGNPSKTLNYFQRLTQAQSKLNKQQQKSYIVRPWVDEHDLAWIYSHATTAVSRSGANTIQELVVHSLPSLLIPLPFSHNNEQQKNAEILANAKCAIMLLQKDLTPESFLEKLQEIKDQQDSFKKRATKLQDQFILNGSTTLLNLIDQTLVRKTN